MPDIMENLDPSQWTTEEQQAMFDALVPLLGVDLTPPIDYTGMDDTELGATLEAVATEISGRPTAVTKQTKHVIFGSHVVILKDEG